jgi:glycosyltransferase involved in cell wall biosynthesis
MLRRHLPEGTTASFVGHANLSERTLSALRSVPGLCLQVMIHDTIPLDWPAFQRAGTPEAFAAKLDAVARHADVIICPTRSAAADVARHLAPRGARATVVVAPLGVEIAAPDPAAVPAGVPVTEPYFVVLGTIEPRKNHGLLLDAWEMLGPSAPWLLVCGTRGWRNEATFARLDRHPDRVMELAGLTDGAITALLQDARALLFPSLAEGYGLPLAEAGALGTPVICSDLPVCREVAAADAEFLDPHDAGAWAAAVSRHRALATDRKRQTAPDWVSHFKIALAMT